LITVKLLGGAKKIFDKDLIQADFDNITIEKLFEYLLSVKPANTLDLDTKNILVAVNGADSSALQGHNTILHEGDTVSIIPIIHGGSQGLELKVCGKNVSLYNIIHEKGKNYKFLAKVRKKFPDIIMEGISSKNIASVSHVSKIVALSLYAQKHNLLLSKKRETDILLRFAATTQISVAIKMLGIEQQDEFTIIAVGSKSLLARLYQYLKPYLKEIDYTKNSKYIQKQFKISKKQIQSVISKTPLEDLIVEKAAVLVQ